MTTVPLGGLQQQSRGISTNTSTSSNDDVRWRSGDTLGSTAELAVSFDKVFKTISTVSHYIRIRMHTETLYGPISSHPPHIINMLRINLLNASRFERISLASKGWLGRFEMCVSVNRLCYNDGVQEAVPAQLACVKKVKGMTGRRQPEPRSYWTEL